MRQIYKKLALISVALTLAVPAIAVPLVPGGVVFTTGDTAAANPALPGGVANDNLIAFSYDPTPATPATNIGGNIQNRVVQSNTLGTLIFATRIRDTFNIDGGTFSILGFQLEGYGSATTDVDFRLDGLGSKGFSSVSRSADGDLMTFRYADRLFVDAINPPGRQETSFFPSIVTDATEFDLTGTMTIFGEILPLGAVDDSASNSQNIFTITVDGIAVPKSAIPPVPIPAGGGFLIGALGLLGWLRRRAPAHA
jgi:hypothetical protein